MTTLEDLPNELHHKILGTSTLRHRLISKRFNEMSSYHIEKEVQRFSKELLALIRLSPYLNDEAILRFIRKEY